MLVTAVCVCVCVGRETEDWRLRQLAFCNEGVLLGVVIYWLHPLPAAQSMEEQLSNIVKDKAELEAKIITATTELEVGDSSDSVIVVMV